MSERVLYEWRFAGYVCRIVESEPGIVHFEQAQGPPIGQEATGPLAFNRTEKPIGCANEIIHLSQALAEANIINRDLSKAIQGWQEDRNRRESELAHLTARIAELEAENARLRRCMEAADKIDGFAVAGSVLIEQRGDKRGGEEVMEYVKAYRAARAEVDNG